MFWSIHIVYKCRVGLTEKEAIRIRLVYVGGWAYATQWSDIRLVLKHKGKLRATSAFHPNLGLQNNSLGKVLFFILCYQKWKALDVELILPFFAERNACLLVKNLGVCKGHFMRFHYDAVHEKCKKFFYTGCGGNGNRFPNKDVCMTTCAGVKRDGRSKCTTTFTADSEIYAKMWGERNIDFWILI